MSKLFCLQPIYTNGMIFQRECNIRIEGEALEPCEITASIGGDSVCATVEPGHFSLLLPPRKADRGLTLTVSARACNSELSHVLVFNNIYIGEIWFAGGQSNMQWALQDTDEYRQNPYVKENEDLRFYTVGRNIMESPDKFKAGYEWAYAQDHGWVGCNEECAVYFSAVAYHFAHTLYEAIKVPIGIINCNVGGSSVFAWIPREDIIASPDVAYVWEQHCKVISETDPEKASADYYKYLDDVAKTSDISRNISGLSNELPVYYYGESGPFRFQNPEILYKAMLEKVSTFPARGMLWYQGESEGWYEAGNHYAAALEALVGNMKRRQNNPDFAFNYVQIAPFGDSGIEYWARVCDQMRRFFLRHPDYAMITIGDVGCAKDVHPPQKRPLGERLAYAAMNRSYEFPHEFTGPIAESALRLGDEVRISFLHGAGLHQRNKEPGRFELVYEDGTVKEAVPEIRDDAVYLPLPEGPTPKLVRYEFVACAEVGIFNRYGYPASLFEVEVW